MDFDGQEINWRKFLRRIKGGGRRNRRAEPSDGSAGLAPVKGERQGRRTGGEEQMGGPQTAVLL